MVEPMSDRRIIPPGSVLPPMIAGGGGAAPAGNTPAARPRPADPSPAPDPQTPRRPRRSTPEAATGAAKRHADRFRVLNEFIDVTMRNLSDAAAKAWFVLYRDTKPNGLAKVGLSDLATRMGCSVSTAKRAIRELRRRGLVSVDVRGRPGRGPSVYRLGVGSDGDDAGPSRRRQAGRTPPPLAVLGVTGDPQ
jgi:hypothetical protein